MSTPSYVELTRSSQPSNWEKIFFLADGSKFVLTFAQTCRFLWNLQIHHHVYRDRFYVGLANPFQILTLHSFCQPL